MKKYILYLSTVLIFNSLISISVFMVSSILLALGFDISNFCAFITGVFFASSLSWLDKKLNKESEEK